MEILKLFDRIEKHRKQCKKFLSSSRCTEEIRPFYERELPSSDSFIDQCKFTSIDFETTGVDPTDNYILSIGGIGLVKNSIDFNTSFHYFVNNSKYIKKDSAVINQITPEQLINGKDPVAAVVELLDKISGGIVLVHCKYIEMNFIKKTLGLEEKDPLPFIVFDTMSIEKNLRRNEPNPDVRLVSIREKRGFPAYEAHNALVDSLATAEVFLAQLKDLFGNKRATVGPVAERS